MCILQDMELPISEDMGTRPFQGWLRMSRDRRHVLLFTKPGPWKPPTECTPALTEESVRIKPPHACCCSRRQWDSVSRKLESAELVSWRKWGFIVPGNMGRNLVLEKSGEPGTRQGNGHRAKAAVTRASHSDAGAPRNECVCLACLPSASPA